MTTNSSALADALEDEEWILGCGCGKGGGRHEEISTVTVSSMVTFPPTDEVIFANEAELKRWDVYNKQLYSVLFLCTIGAANSFLVRFVGRPDSRQQTDGQAAWKTMPEK